MHAKKLINPTRKPAAKIAALLLNWYGKNRRDLPWRQTRDPYRVWLSEIMLQQTQVATVIPYYQRFLERFPTVQDLAAADQDEVLKLWAGLGYYSRARNLHRGAQVIAQRFGGHVPDSAELIRQVPGIGAYTAGAVLSIAYDKPEPLVDGNVARVLARVYLLNGDYRKSEGKLAAWAAARELMAASCGRGKKRSPGDLNQALMELGATVCLPRSPSCAICPLSLCCLARKNGLQNEYPQLEGKAAVPVWQLRAWIVKNARGELLFAQRGAKGLFGGLWEVPTERPDLKSIKAQMPARFIKQSQNWVRHVLTHRVLEIEVRRSLHGDWFARSHAPAEFPCWSGKYTLYRWLSPRSALNGNEIAVSSAQHKILLSAE